MNWYHALLQQIRNCMLLLAMSIKKGPLYLRYTTTPNPPCSRGGSRSRAGLTQGAHRARARQQNTRATSSSARASAEMILARSRVTPPPMRHPPPCHPMRRTSSRDLGKFKFSTCDTVSISTLSSRTCLDGSSNCTTSQRAPIYT